MPKVTIYTQVYNAKRYIEQCVNSVLNQTFTDFQYLLVDSASTDGSSEVLDAFAAQDSRIKLIHLPENQMWAEPDMLRTYATGEYFAALDHDDWLEPDFLERTLAFLEGNCLDVACTGSVMHHEATGNLGARRLPHQLIVERPQFPVYYPVYHQFFRTRWNKLVRMDAYLSAYDAGIPPLVYGGDTVLCFQLLRRVSRIGIDDTVLHHYRIRSDSQSSQYSPKRFDADVYCYNDAFDFLNHFGPVSDRDRVFVQCVYANAVMDTSDVIARSTLPVENKLRELRRIAEHPVTHELYRHPENDPDLQRSREVLWQTALQIAHPIGADGIEVLAIAKELFPQCAQVLTTENLPLLERDQEFLGALLHDDKLTLSDLLLDCICRNRYVKQFDIAQMFLSLIPESSPLCAVQDTKFFKKYQDLVRALLHGQYEAALDEMTGVLLDQGKVYCTEDFLQLYLTLAALEEQTSAFLFGKIRLAQWYQREGRTDECRALLRELEEMGAGENEEVKALYQT